MRRLDSYIRKYGAVAGPKLYRALQSQAAHAGVSARLRRKIAGLKGTPTDGPADQATPAARPPMGDQPVLPMFGEDEIVRERAAAAMAVGA